MPRPLLDARTILTDPATVSMLAEMTPGESYTYMELLNSYRGEKNRPGGRRGKSPKSVYKRIRILLKMGILTQPDGKRGGYVFLGPRGFPNSLIHAAFSGLVRKQLDSIPSDSIYWLPIRWWEDDPDLANVDVSIFGRGGGQSEVDSSGEMVSALAALSGTIGELEHLCGDTGWAIVISRFGVSPRVTVKDSPFLSLREILFLQQQGYAGALDEEIPITGAVNWLEGTRLQAARELTERKMRKKGRPRARRGHGKGRH